MFQTANFWVILRVNRVAQSIQAAILSKDAAFVSLIRKATAKLDIELVEMDDALRYIDLIAQEPFDLVLFDCQGSPAAGKHLLATLRQSSANREAVFMIAGAAQGDDASAGTDFAESVLIPKSLTPEKAEQYLREAVQVIVERQRHYNRHPLDIGVLLAGEAKQWELEARSLNLSEGGIRLQLPRRPEFDSAGGVRISFELPDGGGKLEIPARLAWINNDLQAGFRFKLTTSTSARLSAWLNQHAAPVPGSERKQIVESWLAKHGSAGETVVISAGLGKEIFSLPKTSPKPAAAEAIPEESFSAQAPETASGALKGRFIWYSVISLFLGMAIGFALSRLYHLF